MNEDEAKLAAWVGVCCVLGGLAILLVALAVRSCA